MVADASETTFRKVSSLHCTAFAEFTLLLQHYPTIMPLLLNVLRNANGPGYRKLRVKAMECAGLIGLFLMRYANSTDVADCRTSDRRRV